MQQSENVSVNAAIQERGKIVKTVGLVPPELVIGHHTTKTGVEREA